MISSYLWQARLFLRKVWVRVSAFALLGFATIVLSPLLAGFVPAALDDRIDTSDVRQLLSILASSMLAVTTFSLSIAVNAFAAATSTATPRVVALLQEDRTTQNVLATFLGAFLFSLLGLIALNADYYGDPGETILYGAAIAVVAMVIVAILRWIGHLMSFGRMDDSLDRVEEAAREAIEYLFELPFMGAGEGPENPPEGAQLVPAPRTGWLQHIDVAALSSRAGTLGATFHILARQGDFVQAGLPLIAVDGGKASEAALSELCGAVTIGTGRVFDDDPLFGLIVLSEIASRALSPGVNDPGTAIDVTGRVTRLLEGWRRRAVAEPRHPRVLLPGIDPGDALTVALGPIARDGAGFIEVQKMLQACLSTLTEVAPEAFSAAARELSETAIERARAAGATEAELSAIDRRRPQGALRANPEALRI